MTRVYEQIPRSFGSVPSPPWGWTRAQLCNDSTFRAAGSPSVGPVDTQSAFSGAGSVSCARRRQTGGER